MADDLTLFDLFDLAEPEVRRHALDPHAFLPAVPRDTQTAVAAAALPRSGTQRARVLEVIRQAGGGRADRPGDRGRPRPGGELGPAAAPRVLRRRSAAGRRLGRAAGDGRRQPRDRLTCQLILTIDNWHSLE